MALRDQPYLPLYIKDFMSDEVLRECSAKACGVYIFIMCVLHKQEEYGSILLQQNDKQTDQQIKNFAIKFAKHLPFDLDTIISSIIELVDKKVLRIKNDILYQKRMLNDGRISTVRSESAKGNKGFAIAKYQANNIANSDIDNDNDNPLFDDKEEIDDGLFELFWDQYEKKVGKKDKIKKKFDKLSQKDKLDIFEYIPKYIQAQPDKIYRKNPETFLNNESWKDEIIVKEKFSKSGPISKIGEAMLITKNYGKGL